MAYDKKRLQKYLDLCQEINNQQERLERMISAVTSPTAQPLDDMPHGGGTASNDKIGPALARVDALKKKIAILQDKEADEYWLIDDAVERIPKAGHRFLLRCRYLDRYSWDEVCAALFGNRLDFTDRFESYLRSTYRIHGDALNTLSKLNEQSEPE